ncbi:MAG: hypothetical protein H6755_07870 [Candidatus Omnitrophica bacterium]|nr:hypothetical protein [Candidatus Omnitrophota bacterium]
MKSLKTIFFILIVLMVASFVGLSFYVQLNGKTLIESKLSAVLNKDVSVGKARLLFPLGLRFDNVDIKNVFVAKVLRIYLGIPFFVDGRLNIARVKLIEPTFFITYSADNKIILGDIRRLPVLPDTSKLAIPAPLASNTAKHQAKFSQGININYLKIKSGRVEVLDQARENITDIGSINLNATDVALPARKIKTKFDFTALVLGEYVPLAGQKINARGMINIVARDMDAVIELVGSKGKSSFKAHLKAVANEMMVKGKINIGRFISSIKTEDSRESSLEGFLVNALESSGKGMEVDFMCQTKMDTFNCDKLGLSGKVVGNKKKP